MVLPTMPISRFSMICSIPLPDGQVVSLDAEQEESELPPAHAQSGHQQGRYHADEDVFDVGHASTAFLVAGSSPRIASVSSISHQKVGLAGEVSGQKQPTVQSRYSANAKHSTPMWKQRIFRAAPVCVFV